MQWVPFGGPAADFNDHIRTFAAVFPEVTLVKGAGGYGAYMLGSTQPIAFDEANIRAVLARPGRPRGHLVGLRLAGQDGRRLGRRHPPPDVADRRRRSRSRPATGPLITDDRPRPEYFILRLLFGQRAAMTRSSYLTGAPAPATMSPPTNAGGRMTARTLTASRALLGTTLPFALPIGLSAFLLFSVEPLVGRLVLPVFGGTPAVWATRCSSSRPCCWPATCTGTCRSRGSASGGRPSTSRWRARVRRAAPRARPGRRPADRRRCRRRRPAPDPVRHWSACRRSS